MELFCKLTRTFIVSPQTYRKNVLLQRVLNDDMGAILT